MRVGNGEEARQAIEGWEGMDIIVQPDPIPDYRLFIADMDSTMIGQECIDELGDMAGVGGRIAEITERAMQGELDFRGALAARVELLADQPAGIIDRCIAERIRPREGAERLVRTLKARGVRCVLVSGGFTRFADRIGADLGFDRVVANRLGEAEGRLTGRVDGDVVDGAVKERVLREEAGEGASLAIGDGANDLAMIRAATVGIAFRAKPILAEAAEARLDHHPLDALLWALGIRREDWV